MFPLSIMEAVPPKPFQDPAAELPSVGRRGPRLDRMLQLAQEIGHAELLFPAARGNQELLDVEPAAGLVHDSLHARIRENSGSARCDDPRVDTGLGRVLGQIPGWHRDDDYRTLRNGLRGNALDMRKRASITAGSRGP